ncbi:ATP-binding protein [Aureimonas jatrophae]|uniref:histidine kinase n=1 Tax=Aureimonas jatrophae TaxID=1166073 RepID=A0A1H0DGM5_9HYPH|nr:ATP-binding protein [Aureimonas jatrophae]MBB3951879.1 signal transduction histidine kinase [Aureimonas jatrophae]SDN69254.1 Signal transduction histidine kinase [Aureimonas jatrophae]
MSRVLHWWHRSLTVQLLGSMLIALFASQSIGIWISWGKFQSDMQTAARTELASRAAAVARLIETAPDDVRSGVARVNSTEYTRFWISRDATPDLREWVEAASERFETPLRVLLNGAQDGTPPMAAGIAGSPFERPAAGSWQTGALWTTPVAGQADLPPGAAYLDYDDRNGAGVIVPLDNGLVLNVAFHKEFLPSIWKTHLPLALALTAILVSIVAMVILHGVSGPLRQLTQAADTLGRGEPVPPLKACGTDDVRRTAEAFNRMQERLHRFVEDRTRMLAAIGHDLRTPITTLRLRTEFIEDAELKDRMLSSIGELEEMTEATLSLARQDTTNEATRTIDLSALVESVCEDLAELGQSVNFSHDGRVAYRCRPENLKRMVRNIVENAVRYAGHAEVRLVSTSSGVEILVEDDGPGIPVDRMEDVFTPFVRLEDSRSRDTGGAGLGLSIARAIARQHGGDILLTLRSPGLRATATLPA